MSKPQSFLGTLLIMQLIFTGGIYAYHQQLESSQAQGVRLLSFSKEGIDKLTISDKDNSTTLLKKNGTWVIDDEDKLPVEKEKIDSLLDTLVNLKGSWPVATTKDSYEQLEVADKKFSRKIELFKGSTPVAQLLMGTSPSFRKTNVRSTSNSSVYTVELSSADAPALSEQWLDHNLLAVENPSKISGPDFTIEKPDKEWKLNGKGTLNQSNAESLARIFKNLRVENKLATEPGGPANLSYELKVGANPLTIQVWLKGDKASIKRNDIHKTFELAKPVYDELASFNLAKLTEKEAKDEKQQGKVEEKAPNPK